jgi:hypothetical protein
MTWWKGVVQLRMSIVTMHKLLLMNADKNTGADAGEKRESRASPMINNWAINNLGMAY